MSITDLYNKLVDKFSTGAHVIDTGMHDWYTTDSPERVHAHFMLESRGHIAETANRLATELDCNVDEVEIQYNVHYVLTPKEGND